MNYHFDDVQKLLASAPRFHSFGSALRYLRDVAQSGDELRSTLQRYPAVKYEPLEFFYICLQSLAVLNEALIFDLTRFHGWHGKEWASLLACFSPDPKYVPHLVFSAASDGPRPWAAQMALDIAHTRDVGDRGELHQVLADLRQLLTAVRLPMAEIRKAPCVDFLEARADAVRQAYREGGLQCALDTLRRVEAHHLDTALRAGGSAK